MQPKMRTTLKNSTTGEACVLDAEINLHLMICHSPTNALTVEQRYHINQTGEPKFHGKTNTIKSIQHSMEM